jgi:hypothetical protein
MDVEPTGAAVTVGASDITEVEILFKLSPESDFMTDEGVETAVGAGRANDASNLFAEMCSMILNTFAGLLDLHMIVETPPADAISAAMSFVSIPPVPSLDPRVAVLTSRRYYTKCQE